MIYIVSFLILTYCFFISLLIIGIYKCSKTQEYNHAELPNITIIIPFRNEEKNIGKLLRSISQLNYPKEKLEIITINDSSTDNSIAEIKSFQNAILPATLKIIELQDVSHTNYGKKSAVNYGIQIAKSEIIVSTDADCIVYPNWINSLLAYLSPQTMLVCGPVRYNDNNSTWSKLLQLEFFSLIFSGAASIGIKKPSFCNAANMMFRKNIYLEVFDKYGKNYSSGDDVFLLQSISTTYGAKHITFAHTKSAIVDTLPPNNIKSFVLQRLRWASKAVGYKSAFAIFQSLLVYIYSLSIIGLSILSVFSKQYILSTILLISGKLILDLLFFKFSISQLKYAKFNPIIFFLSSILYPVYIVVIASMSFFTKGEWKGRKV